MELIKWGHKSILLLYHKKEPFFVESRLKLSPNSVATLAKEVLPHD